MTTVGVPGEFRRSPLVKLTEIGIKSRTAKHSRFHFGDATPRRILYAGDNIRKQWRKRLSEIGPEANADSAGIVVSARIAKLSSDPPARINPSHILAVEEVPNICKH